MGKIGQAPVRLVSALPATNGRAPRGILLLCPFLSGLDPSVSMWLGPLAWHDCNAALLAALAGPVPAGSTILAGVFCADPFRSPDDLLAALRVAGVGGVVNLPSVTFFGGEFGETLDALNLGFARELAFLRRARELGFQVAGCARERADVEAMLGIGVELVIAHAGPPLPSIDIERASRQARLLRELAGIGVRILSLYDLVVRGRKTLGRTWKPTEG